MLRRITPENKGPVSKLYTIAISAFIISIGFIFLRYSSYCGIIFTDDSFNYYHAAESFLRSGKYISPDQTPFASWPPLFSTVIAFFVLIKILPISVLQYLTYLINGLLLSILAGKLLSTKFEKYFFLAFILISVSMIMIHTFLWSEALFLTILLGFIFRVLITLENDDWRNIVILIILANVLCLQRNAGFFILISVVLFLVLFTDTTWLKRISLLSGGAISFFAWNIYTSFIFTDGFNFLDHQYFSGFFLNIKNLADVGSAWFLPRIIPLLIRLGILGVFLLFIILKVDFRKMYPNKKQILILSIIVVYTGAFAVIGKLDYYEIERYLSVVYPFIIILIVSMLWKLLGRSKLKYIIIPVLSLWLVYSVSRTVKNSIDWHDRSCRLEKNAMTNNNIWLHGLKNR